MSFPRTIEYISGYETIELRDRCFITRNDNYVSYKLPNYLGNLNFILERLEELKTFLTDNNCNIIHDTETIKTGNDISRNGCITIYCKVVGDVNFIPFNSDAINWL